jgi:hypothetical protein
MRPRENRAVYQSVNRKLVSAKKVDHRNELNLTAKKVDHRNDLMNMTMRSKESGTNVSY